MVYQRAIALVAALSLVMLLGGRVARADGSGSGLKGPHLISGHGGGTDTRGETGDVGLAGLIKFNKSGGADAVDITLGWQDNDDANDGFTCHLTNPSDLGYTLSNGVGTLTLTVSASDSCHQTTNPSIAVNKIVFSLYVLKRESLPPEARIASTACSLVDSDGDVVVDPAVVGELESSTLVDD